MKDKAVIVV